MEKPLQITFRDMESSEAVEALVRDRVDRLERVHPRIIGCRVVIETPHRSPEGKPPIGVTVEVTIPGRKTIFASDAQEQRSAKMDHMSVVNRAFDAVQRQLESATDIQRGDVKQSEAAGETGIVARLFPHQNYGFVEVRGSSDLYFTRNAVVGGDFDDIVVGAMVQITRATTEGPMGPQASSVRLLNAPRSPS